MENQDQNILASIEEEGRGCRSKKRFSDPTCCPVCSVTLRNSEMSSHLATEIEKLNKVASTKHKINGKVNPSTSLVNGTSASSSKSESPWETFQKIRSNRHSRQRIKSRKRKNEESVCPICNKEISDDIVLHVELCLRKSENQNDEQECEESIDVENFEEYEWAGQSRIRATSLLSGGVSSLGSSISMIDDDEDLNVEDVDDSNVYGEPQYSERDLIIPCKDEDNLALRKAVIGEEPKITVNEGTSDKETEKENTTKGDPIVEVLKARIKELESRENVRDDIFKCLICMDRYRTPVISVCCWHVHCEQCWLKTLGAKKLCPQCNMITSPADLRRIYM